MNCTPHSFSGLPFSTLFRDYTAQKQEILSFFESNPFDFTSQAVRREPKSFPSPDRRTELLYDFHKGTEPTEQTLANIEKFRDKDTLAVVTGQQLTLFGGPLYTVYKVMSAINLAKSLEKKYKRAVVPVFWLADEDHDYAEAAGVRIPGGHRLHHFELNGQTGSRRVSEIAFPCTIDELRENIRQTLPETDFSDELWNMLSRWYQSGQTFNGAFSGWLMELFGKYGLVLAGSHHPAIKQEMKEVFLKSIDASEEIYQRLLDTSGRLENAGYHKQLFIQKSNLFWIDDEGNRLRIDVHGEEWRTDGCIKKSWSAKSLKEQVDTSPEQFSPNVVLRPVLQDAFLPTVAYVGGPGEIAYYAQLKEIYPVFGKTMPAIVPRFSATISESSIQRVMKQLPFGFETYSERIEDLESEYIQRSDSPDVEAVFSEWKKQVADITERMKKHVAEIDPTLESSAGKASATYYSELDKLKGKVYRSLKQQEKVQLTRIRKIKNSLFPDGNLQEREVAWFYFANKYGLNLFDQLLEMMEDLPPDTHYMIEL